MVAFRLTLPVEPVSKKNSQGLNLRGDKPRVFPSTAYRKYEQAVEGYFWQRQLRFCRARVNVKALYYMGQDYAGRKKVDLSNLNSALHDVLVKFGVLEDDDCRIVAGTDGSRVFLPGMPGWVSPPRTEITITELGEDE